MAPPYSSKKFKSTKPADNPYNPFNKLYKDITKLMSVPLANYQTPPALLNKPREPHKYYST